MKSAVKFKRQFDPNYKGQPYDNPIVKSQTVPDMNKSIRQLMEQNVKHNNLPEPKQEYYEDDIGGEVPRHEDMVDVLEFKEELEKKAKQLEADLAEKRKQRAAQAAQKAREELKAEIKAEQAKE